MAQDVTVVCSSSFGGDETSGAVRSENSLNILFVNWSSEDLGSSVSIVTRLGA
jgi:hypothetical protein